jgi:hypothetical protein
MSALALFVNFLPTFATTNIDWIRREYAIQDLQLSTVPCFGAMRKTVEVQMRRLEGNISETTCSG